ncbi:hypothetical protein ACWCQ0_46185 [Streptomyces massasporeus]
MPEEPMNAFLILLVVVACVVLLLPVLVFIATAVRFGGEQRDRRRLKARGAVHEVYRYDAGHGSLVVEERIKQVGLDLAFAAKHLGGGPVAG